MMTDPIADMLTRLRNAQGAGKKAARIPYSRQKEAILGVLVAEGYVESVTASGEGSERVLEVGLKYYQGRPVIETIRRVSKPGLRIYKSRDDLPTVNAGLGIAVVSTSKGIMTDKSAREAGHGGEVLCTVY
ncbi:MAG: 30S ribosomal protein S8 [Thioalkalivibrionaceae bacterium]